MSDAWRLLDTGHLPAAANMALDRVILTARSKDLVPNTVRFLQFSPHCVLVGYHQAVGWKLKRNTVVNMASISTGVSPVAGIFTGMRVNWGGRYMPAKIRRVFLSGCLICTA